MPAPRGRWQPERVLNSAIRTDQPDTWWSAGLRPHELIHTLTRSAPAWAEYVERSISLPPSAPAAGRDPAGTGVTGGHTSGGAAAATDGSGTDWRQALMRCLAPLLDSARQDLAAAGHTGAVAEEFLHRLGLRLVKLAARTLVLELARARDRGELAGDTPAARFLDFTHRLVGGSELAEFLATYPVLARVLGESCRQSVEGHLELMARLAEDRESLVTGLLDGRDPGALTAIEPSGDPHRGGPLHRDPHVRGRSAGGLQAPIARAARPLQHVRGLAELAIRAGHPHGPAAPPRGLRLAGVRRPRAVCRPGRGTAVLPATGRRTGAALRARRHGHALREPDRRGRPAGAGGRRDAVPPESGAGVRVDPRSGAPNAPRIGVPHGAAAAARVG